MTFIFLNVLYKRVVVKEFKYEESESKIRE